MKTRLLVPEKVSLQVIDVQKSLMAKIHGATVVAENVALLVRCAKVLSVPVIANTQYKKGLGPYVEEVEAVVADVPQIDKVEFNALANRETAAAIDKLAPTVSTVVLVGVETHICIYQTAMGLLDKGLDVWVVSDAVSSRQLADHQAGLARMAAAGVTVGPAEMLIYELLGKAGTPQFKEILPFIIAQGK